MALEEFENRQLSEREKGLIRMKSITNYGMGAFIILTGVFFLIHPAMADKYFARYDRLDTNIFGIVCLIYGLFRVFRGYKKNYFRN